MSIREFIQTWSGSELKEMGKEDRMFSVNEDMYSIVEFYITKAHNKKHLDTVNKLYRIFGNEKFINTVEKMTKKKAEYPLVPEFAMVLSDYVEKRSKELGDEKVAQYAEIIDRLIKPRVKEIKEKVDVPKQLISEMFLVLPDDKLINPKFINIYINRALRKMYVVANVLEAEEIENMSTKDLKKLFKTIFGKDNFGAVLQSISLERGDLARNFNSNQLALWGKISNVLLEELEDMKKKQIKGFLMDYVEFREKMGKENRDFNRRIDFTALSNMEDCTKISKVVCSVIEKDEEAKRKLQ